MATAVIPPTKIGPQLMAVKDFQKEPAPRYEYLVYDASADETFDGNPRLMSSIPEWVLAGNRHGLNIIVDLVQNERCFRGKWDPIPFVPVTEFRER